MKGFIEEYGKTIFAVICTILCISLLAVVFSNQLAPFMQHAYKTQEKISNRTAVGREGSKVSSNKELSDKQKGKTAIITFSNPLYTASEDSGNMDVNGLNLMIREKQYTFPLSNGSTYSFNGSEMYAFNNNFKAYGIDSANDTRPWYILSLNPHAKGLASKDSTTRVSNIDATTTFNDITTVTFDFESKVANSKDYILLTFDKDNNGNIKVDSQNRPILKAAREVSSLKYSKEDGKTLKSLSSDFDVIVFKKPGYYRVRYYLTDKAGYSYYTYAKLSVENTYGIPEDSIYETLWNKF